MSTEREPLLRRQMGSQSNGEQYPPAFSGDDVMETNERANVWARIRCDYKEEMAELLGTFVFVLFGSSVDCQVNVTNTGSGFLSVNVGWAVGLALGVWIAGGVSGGHVNPAITIAQALFRGFSWKKVPTYILAQVLGGMLATLAAFANYRRQIKMIDPGLTLKTSKLFHSAPGQDISGGGLFYSEVLGTALLMGMILAFQDKSNMGTPKGCLPFAIFLLLLGIGCSMGVNTSYSLNPARDLGPRLACLLLGYHGVFSHDHLYWIWNGVLAPIVGACLGNFIYDAMVYTGVDSILNMPDRKGRIQLANDPEARGN